MTTEIEYLIQKREGLNPTTKTNYINYYKRLRNLTEQDIRDMDNENLIEVIETAQEPHRTTHELRDTPISVKQSFLNVAIVIKQIYNKDIDELITYRSEGTKKLVQANAVKNVELKETLPKVKDLIAFMNERYDQGDYVAYIINYLILTFNTRNMDLNLTIVKDSKSVNDKDNWLVLRKDSVRYMRYEFKTATTYECFENVVKSPKFINAVKEILKEQESTPLLKAGDKRIEKVSLNKFISNRTYEKIGQAKYLKAILAEKDTLTKLEKISSNRGTAIQTLIENYSPNFTDEIGKKAKEAKKSGCKGKVSVSGQERKAQKKKTKQEEIAKAQAEHNSESE